MANAICTSVAVSGGKTMIDPTVEQAGAALARFEEFVAKQLARTFWSGSAVMCASRDFVEREWWIDARRAYLKEVLTAAVKSPRQSRLVGPEPTRSRPVTSTHKEVKHG